MKTSKKIFSVLMALIIFSACFAPVFALAEETGSEPCAHNWVLYVTQPSVGCINGKGYYKCTVCEAAEDTFLPAGEHDFEWVVDQPATQFSTGKKHQVCKNCGLVRNMNTKIPVNKNSKGFYDAASRFFAGIVATLKSIVEQAIAIFKFGR